MKNLPEALVDAINNGAQLFPVADNSSLVDDITTRILENNLTALESLRASLDRAGQKDIPDVRDFGDTMGGAALFGFEQRIGYSELLDVIDHFKKGIAARHLA